MKAHSVGQRSEEKRLPNLLVFVMEGASKMRLCFVVVMMMFDVARCTLDVFVLLFCTTDSYYLSLLH